MEVVYQSLKAIDGLRRLYPGDWKYTGRDVWSGDKFQVRRINGKFIRSDTGKEIKIYPKRKKRSHFIHKILEEKFGGKWSKVDSQRFSRWKSEDHPFWVYATGYMEDGRFRRAYRRNDTKEIVYASDGRKF